MRLMLKGVMFAAALWVMGGRVQAADGLLLVQKTTSGGTTQTNQIQIESKRMRAESSGATGGKQIVVFDGVKQVLTMIDPEKISCTLLPSRSPIIRLVVIAPAVE